MLWPTFYSDFIKIAGVMLVIALMVIFFENNSAKHCAIGKWRLKDGGIVLTVFKDKTAVSDSFGRYMCEWDKKDTNIIVLSCDSFKGPKTASILECGESIGKLNDTVVYRVE